MFEDRFLIADIQMHGRLPGRALVLVRSAVQSRPVGAAAQAAGRRLADRPAARLGRGSRGGECEPERVVPRLEAMLGKTGASSSNGSASIPSSAGGWSGSVHGR